MTTGQAALEAAGDRVGGRFRLGGRTGQWARTEYRTRVGCASMFIFVSILFGWIPVVFAGGPGRLRVAEVLGGLLVVAIALAAIPPRRWKYRLFRFEHGLALVDPRHAATTVLRTASRGLGPAFTETRWITMRGDIAPYRRSN